MLALLGLLASHADLIELAVNAIENGGVDKQDLLDQIKRLMREASDAAEKARLGL